VYIGPPFTVNREFAESCGGDWVILSAKYGFLRPTDIIPGPYEVTFKVPSTRPIAVETLMEQVTRMGLDQYAEVIGLGGKEYRAAIESAFRGTRASLEFPFSGLPLGKAMAAAKRSTRRNRSPRPNAGR
jgi:hypothetical protein